MTAEQRQEWDNETMKHDMQRIISYENRFLLLRLLATILIYVATMFVYYGVFVSKEDDQSTRGLALLNPAFIVASDIVILSLRQ